MILLCCAFAACLIDPDETLWQTRPDLAEDSSPDLSPDLAADIGPDAGFPCADEGNPVPCDPISPGGCMEGACYVVKGKGSACVCTPGTAAEGEDCNTTTECAAGHVCAGTVAPGTCRATCDPASSDCPTGMQCTFITAFPEFGYCEPE